MTQAMFNQNLDDEKHLAMLQTNLDTLLFCSNLRHSAYVATGF
jgi:hypothetical protein